MSFTLLNSIPEAFRPCAKDCTNLETLAPSKLVNFYFACREVQYHTLQDGLAFPEQEIYLNTLEDAVLFSSNSKGLSYYHFVKFLSGSPSLLAERSEAELSTLLNSYIQEFCNSNIDQKMARRMLKVSTWVAGLPSFRQAFKALETANIDTLSKGLNYPSVVHLPNKEALVTLIHSNIRPFLNTHLLAWEFVIEPEIMAKLPAIFPAVTNLVGTLGTPDEIEKLEQSKFRWEKIRKCDFIPLPMALPLAAPSLFPNIEFLCGTTYAGPRLTLRPEDLNFEALYHIYNF